MTISRHEFSNILKEFTSIFKKLNEPIEQFVFNGKSVMGISRNFVIPLDLPRYIPDSFVIPSRVVLDILDSEGETITIVRSEKYLEVDTENMHRVYSFVKDVDIEDDIYEYTNSYMSNPV